MGKKVNKKNVIIFAVIFFVVGFFVGQFMHIPAFDDYGFLDAGYHHRR